MTTFGEIENKNTWGRTYQNIFRQFSDLDLPMTNAHRSPPLCPYTAKTVAARLVVKHLYVKLIISSFP